jgi:hypothetical protein
MKLFTITASIVTLVAAITAEEIVQHDRQGHAYWCGEIAGEERVQREIFHDDAARLLDECEPSKLYAQKYAKGDGIVARTVAEVGSFFGSRGYASTPQ